MEAATNPQMLAINISKVSYVRNLGRFAKCVLYIISVTIIHTGPLYNYIITLTIRGLHTCVITVITI